MSTDDASPRALDDVRAAEAGAEHTVSKPSTAKLSNEPDFDAALLAAKLESLAEFAAGAGHEINNPLAVISGRAQLLLRDERDPERRRDLAIIHMQALRVHEMIADMMLFARPPRPRPTTCDVSRLIDRTIDTLRAKAATLELTLERVGAREPVLAEVDGEQIQTAVRAIVDNGLNAMRPGGKIEIELRAPSDEWLELFVRDDGPGIPDAHREHLFDPFYSGREAGRGLGMGLPKAWRIVTNHGGTIAVDPQTAGAANAATRRGATFVVRLPRR
ncbi:MAG: HAMP domain-containing histidine kinase [Planctomycetia bacterium]|nr:HAMP domain-containing histidine kinase [Planctomycetia bacterium]